MHNQEKNLLGCDGFVIVNAAKMCLLKAKDSEIKPYWLRLDIT